MKRNTIHFLFDMGCIFLLSDLFTICHISRFIDNYRSNKILELAKLGIRGISSSNAFLWCSACTQCTKGCPQGVRVHEVMHALKGLISNDEDALEHLSKGFEEILEVLGEEIPFSMAYSLICFCPSEKEEGRSKLDNIVLDALQSQLSRIKKAERPVPKAGEKGIAIIGSGPAGLTAAWKLGMEGYQVTVFESLPEAGGMLRVGIPKYRLSKDVVAINPSWGVGKILGDGQKVTGIELIRCKSVFDENKRFNPKFDEKTTKEIKTDMIISAIGQSPDLSFLGNRVDISRGVIVVDPQTMETSLPGVFAGGDDVSGTGSVIEAIVAGRTAADSIINYLEDLG